MLGCQGGGLYSELIDQGFNRYLGVYAPTDESVDESGVTSYRFAAEEDGPMCMSGTDFYSMTRDQKSRDLVFFLQGGGLCYSELCLAVSSGGAGIPAIDLLDLGASFNPVSDWNQAYVSYCDGSLFTGDVDVDEDGDGQVDRWQRGLMNLSAALGVAATDFPNPERILLAGSSGGGYGTITATMLARLVWPEARLFVLNDAGVGLGLADKPEFVWKLIDEFNANSIVPESQQDMFESGHLAPIIAWQLEEDPNLKVSAVSYTQDFVISQVYLAIEADEFERSLREQTGLLSDDHTGRYASFLPEGTRHTALLGDPSGFVDEESEYFETLRTMLGGMDTTSIGGVSLGSWIADFVETGPGWVSLSD